MKVEIDADELKLLRSRAEKYLAYMDMLDYRKEDRTYVETLLWKVAELEKEIKRYIDNEQELYRKLEKYEHLKATMQWIIEWKKEQIELFENQIREYKKTLDFVDEKD